MHNWGGKKTKLFISLSFEPTWKSTLIQGHNVDGNMLLKRKELTSSCARYFPSFSVGYAVRFLCNPAGWDFTLLGGVKGA